MRTYAAAVLLLALTACGTTTGQRSDPGAVEVPRAGWQRVAGFPLSPRTDPVLAWTGSEVIVIGGNAGWICPPNADCTAPTDLLADGAAWDPSGRTWRRIADAPVEFLAGWYCQPCATTVGGRVIVDASDLDGRRWLSYDPTSDTWERLVTPDKVVVDLAQHDDTRVWGFRAKDVVSWDPLSGDVRVEATYDPDRPLDDAALVLTDRGPVVTGVRYDDAAPDEPTLAQVDVPTADGGWRRLGTQQLGWLRHWTGEVLIGVERGSADGGDVDGWDRAYPFAGALDPETGRWSEVDVPDPGDAWPISAESGPRVVTGGQYVDVRRLEWTPVGRPETRLDAELSSTWADDVLFVVGGVDAELGYEAPAAPEVWTWTPPAG